MRKILLLAGMLFSASVFAANYESGFVWDRYKDWTPGLIPGSSLGSTDDDKLGNPAWFYGNIKGGAGLDSDSPWYSSGVVAPQVWDDFWQGAIANQAWARAYNGYGMNKIGANPPISRGNMIHDLSQNTGSWNYKPVIQWLNPVGNGAIVDIHGQLTVTWNGHGLTTFPDIPVEVAFAKYDASKSSYELLYSTRLDNPLSGDAYSSVVRLPLPNLDLASVRFDEGDFLSYSLRGISGPQWPAAWVGLTDKVTIKLVTQVPEPSEWMLLLGGLAVVIAGSRKMANTARV